MRTLLPWKAAAAVAVLLTPALAQRTVSLDGAPFLSEVVVPPAAASPPCVPAGGPPCPLPLAPIPVGIIPTPGGEAVDELTATVWATDGFVLTSTPVGACAPTPPMPWPAWPPGPCGPIGGAPIIAMSDAAGAGTLWILDMTGLVSLVPVFPGPPLAQAFAPVPMPGALITSLTFDPVAGLLHFTEVAMPMVFATPLPVGFACAPLPIFGATPIPPCLPPPYVGVTYNSTAPVVPGLPSLLVTDGVIVADLALGFCTCPLIPPAMTPTVDLDFANVPNAFGGPNCGACPSTIGIAGGLPVLGNAGFAITGTGGPPGSFGVLLLGGAPAFVPIGGGCTLLVAPPLVVLPAVPVLPTGGGPCTDTATFPVPIPAGAALAVGAPFYFQWLFFPSPAPAGFEMSDALELFLGFA